MRLNDIKTTPLTFKDALSALQSEFGLERVGGPARVYKVAGQLGVVFLVHGGPKAVGLTWVQGSTALSKVCVWNHFNAAHAPDVVADVPEGIAVHDAVEQIKHFVAQPHMGVVESLSEDAAPVEPPEAEAPPQKLYIMARGPNGEFFEVPGMEQVAANLSRKFAAERRDTSGLSMEEQYEKLTEKVKLVASNRSTYIKSLLITGAPSSGKTFTVMKTIKELGLVEGKDYVVIKGSITDAAAYQTLIEQIDGLTIFDDCDSVVQTTNGKNMMKNALDTYAIRDVGRPTNNSINTKVMSTEDRKVFVDAMSRVLRGKATADDLRHFERYGVDKKKKAAQGLAKHLTPYINDAGDIVLPDIDNDLELDGNLADRQHELQAYFTNHLPNRIDFSGRIIFISNMQESEWDTAILTRAFRQNMAFADGEMLDFLDKIKDHIAAPGLTSEQKQEVMAYLRELFEHGQLNSPINFRLVQQCFDLRLTTPWKMMMTGL